MLVCVGDVCVYVSVSVSGWVVHIALSGWFNVPPLNLYLNLDRDRNRNRDWDPPGESSSLSRSTGGALLLVVRLPLVVAPRPAALGGAALVDGRSHCVRLLEESPLGGHPRLLLTCGAGAALAVAVHLGVLKMRKKQILH